MPVGVHRMDGTGQVWRATADRFALGSAVLAGREQAEPDGQPEHGQYARWPVDVALQEYNACRRQHQRAGQGASTEPLMRDDTGKHAGEQKAPTPMAPSALPIPDREASCSDSAAESPELAP